MSLKADTQNAIVDPNQKLLDILHKAVILSHHLKSEEFKQLRLIPTQATTLQHNKALGYFQPV